MQAEAASRLAPVTRSASCGHPPVWRCRCLPATITSTSLPITEYTAPPVGRFNPGCAAYVHLGRGALGQLAADGDGLLDRRRASCRGYPLFTSLLVHSCEVVSQHVYLNHPQVYAQDANLARPGLV